MPCMCIIFLGHIHPHYPHLFPNPSTDLPILQLVPFYFSYNTITYIIVCHYNSIVVNNFSLLLGPIYKLKIIKNDYI